MKMPAAKKLMSRFGFVAATPQALGQELLRQMRLEKTMPAAKILRLIRKGAALDVKDEGGAGALHWAAFKNQAEIVGALLATGAKIYGQDRAGNTPLHWAVAQNASAAARLLLQAGAQPGARNHQGVSAEEQAALKGNVAILQAIHAPQDKKQSLHR